MKDENIKKAVRDGYGKIAKGQGSCCGPGTEENCRTIGYREAELKSVPLGANLGLGCGNPVALAALEAGDTVLDLGSGAGLDCFLAAARVGQAGKVIGVDMTPEMIEKAQDNARQGDYRNVEFRLGEIERLPVPDDSVDVVISNCVINLAPDKKPVFKEVFRVLKPGGRLMISDLVLLKDLPKEMKNSAQAYVGCVAGAIKKDEYLAAIKAAGFNRITVAEETPFFAKTVASIRVSATKPFSRGG